MSSAKLTGLLSATAFILISGVATATPDDANRISGITVREEPEETVITIAAERTPTFSVFKLEEPVRLFVDVPQGDISKVADGVMVDNGVLDRVATMQIKSNGTPVGRIILGLRQSAAYDIKAIDRGIVIRIDGAGRRPSQEDGKVLAEQVDKIRAELAREKELLEKIRETRERDSKLRLTEEQSRLEAERLRAKAEELKKAAEVEAREAGRLAAEEKTRLEETRKARIAEEKTRGQLTELARLEAAKLDDLRRSRENEEKLVAQLAQARNQNVSAKVSEIEARLEKARAEKASGEKEIAALRTKIDLARTEATKASDLAREAERLQASVVAEKQKLEKLTRDSQEASKAWSEATGRLKTEELRLKAIAQRREAAEQEVAALRAEVDNLKSARKAVETAEARKLREQMESRESELKELRARVEKAGEVADAATIRLAAKEKEISDLKAGLEGQRRTLQQKLEAEKAAATAALSSREREIRELRDAAEKARAAAAASDGRLTESQKQAIAKFQAKEKELQAARVEAEKTARNAEATLARERGQAEARMAAREKELESLRAAMIAAKKAAEEEGRSKALAQSEAEVRKLREKYEGALADVRETNRKQEQTIRDLSRQVASAQEDADQARREIALKEQKISSLTSELAQLQQVSSRQEKAEVSRLSKLVAEREAELKRVNRAKASGAAKDRQVATAAASLREARDMMSAAERREREAVAREQAAQKRIAELTAIAGSSEDRLAQKQKEVERLNSELAAARTALDSAAESGRRELSEQIDRLTAELAQAREAENRTARQANAAAQAEIDRLNAELAKAKAAGRAATGVASVKAIDFKKIGSVPSVILTLDGSADYSVSSRDGAYVLTVSGASLPKELARRLDVTAFKTPVNMVSSFATENGTIQIVAELSGQVGQEIARRDGKLVWTFSGPAPADMFASSQPVPRVGRTVAQATPPPAPAAPSSSPEMAEDPSAQPQGYLRPSMVPKKKKYQGKRINLTVKDADMQNVLTFLAREGKVNIVTSEEVKGKVTFHLEDVPWDLALDTVLKAKGMDYVVEQGIFRVASAESIQKEYEAKVEKAKKQRELKPVVVRLVPVNYGRGQEMATRLKDVLSDKGSVSVDERTNTLVIKDTEDYLQAAEDLVKRLDQQTPQILIEARIVEARTTFSEDIGIQWGGNFAMNSAYGNETGLVFPSSLGLAGGATPADPSGGLTLDNPNWAVNLPAAVGTGSGGAIGIQLGSIGGIGNLTLRLSAAEETGDVKIISSPRISTLDNRKASISQGVQIPISVVSAAGVNTQFFSADLKLDVEPHVTRDGHINLKLDISKNEPDFGNLAANGNPTIQKKEAHTELLIRDGDTTVIGGIYTRSTGKSFKKIPFLGDIPVLGWLFKSRNRSDDRSELLIFITPKVVNREVSL